MSAIRRYGAALMLWNAAALADPAPAGPAPAATAPPDAAAAQTPAPDKAAPRKTKELGGVDVHGKRDSLSESDRRLRELLNKLPDPGEGEKPKDNLGQRARAAIENAVKNDTDPNKRSPEGKQFMQKALDPLNAHAGDPAGTTSHEDYQDQYCGTGECPH